MFIFAFRPPALSGGLAAVAGAALLAIAGTSALGFGTTGAISGFVSLRQTSKREKLLEEIFNHLEAEMGKIKELYKDKAEDVGALVKSIQDMLKV